MPTPAALEAATAPAPSQMALESVAVLLRAPVKVRSLLPTSACVLPVSMVRFSEPPKAALLAAATATARLSMLDEDVAPTVNPEAVSLA